MENIPLPTKIEFQKDKGQANTGIVTIEPCYPGYGVTWGNALRRVLLSSLPGGAVTAVKIKGVKHEFSVIPNVKEDVLQVVLNLKKLCLKVFSDKPIELKLKAKGEGKIKAKDIQPDAQVKILNPELEIATLTSKKAELEMKIWAESDRGYIPVEEKQSANFEVNTIVMDSLYNPVVNVGLNIENVRVGRRTDYDRLKITIKTDGTISPEEAFTRATEMLTEQMAFLSADFRKEAVKEKKAPAKKKAKKKAKPKKPAEKKAAKKKIVKKKPAKTKAKSKRKSAK